MAVEIVTGPPFSGKAAFVREEIAARERDGELGWVAVDFTALYAALVWGVQSSYRDDAVSDTGAPRLAGAAFEWALAAVAARQLNAYITTQSPRRALDLAQRFEGAPVWELAVSVDDQVSRTLEHMEALGRRVRRARGGAADGRCRAQGRRYLLERDILANKARTVKRKPGGKFEKGPRVRAFDRDLWLSGLTPAGRDAVAELVSLGNPEPSPADVFDFMMKNR